MLNPFVLLFSIFGIWTIKFIIPPIIKRIRGNNLPKGSIIINRDTQINKKRRPGNRLSQLSIALGILLQYIILFDLAIHSTILGFADYNLFFIMELPITVNWIGIIGMWLLGVWVSITFTYNVNYTACTNQMKVEKYVLATGGTYKYVRHPAYSAVIFENIFIFLATGVWGMLIGLVGFLALPYQAKEEEKQLKELYGEAYEDYASKTGRFFPKIRKK